MVARARVSEKSVYPRLFAAHSPAVALMVAHQCQKENAINLNDCIVELCEMLHGMTAN